MQYDNQLTIMEDSVKRPPWWSWLSLLGLKAPVAAVAWAVAFSRVFDLVQEVYWTYQFLFVAVWCVTMSNRLLAVFSGDPRVDSEPRLFFAKSNCVWLSFLVAAAVICGLWIIFFQVGVGMVFYASLPLLASILYLLMRTVFKQKPGGSSLDSVECFCMAVAFAFGAAIPAYFYGMPNAGIAFFFYWPTWYLVAFVYLVLMYRRKWFGMNDADEDERKEQADVMYSFCILLLLAFCVFSAIQPSRVGETWFYYALGFGCAGLYLLERFGEKRFGSEALVALGWLVLCLPALFLWIVIPSFG